MADLSKLKTPRRSLGTPPSIEEASPNLRAPEVAPMPPIIPRRDARALRRSNRTIAFATRVTQEFDTRIRDIAERDGLKLVEVLERALDAYESQRSR